MKNLEKKKISPHKYSENKTVNALLESIEKTGGIDKKTADFIRASSREFRENFEFRHDQE
jgi:hypothetical protein